MRAVVAGVLVATLGACVSLAGTTGGNVDPADASVESQASLDATVDAAVERFRADAPAPAPGSGEGPDQV